MTDKFFETLIKKLHTPEHYEHESGRVEIYCYECSGFSGRHFVRYPCRTVRLLDQKCLHENVTATCDDCGVTNIQGIK